MQCIFPSKIKKADLSILLDISFENTKTMVTTITKVIKRKAVNNFKLKKE